MVSVAPPGRLVISKDAASVAREAATEIAAVLRAAIERSGRASLALSGGNTPRDAYGRLAREPGVDFRRVDLLWVDERAVPPADDRSNYRWAKATLLDPASVDPARVHRMLGESSDLPATAREYERILRGTVELDADGVPAIDAVVLGVGDDGHTASLFPGGATIRVRDRLVAAVPAEGSREARLTLTAPVLEHARHAMVLAVGSGKKGALERVWSPQGDVEHTPARLLRACKGSLVWFVDRAAAGSDG